MTFRTSLPLLTAVLPAFAGETAADPATAPRQPNIVFILADDLVLPHLADGQQKILTRRGSIGWRKRACVSRRRIAARVCVLSRCILMTGLHAGHSHVRANRAAGPARNWRCQREHSPSRGSCSRPGIAPLALASGGWAGRTQPVHRTSRASITSSGTSATVRCMSITRPTCGETGRRWELGGKSYSHDLIVSESPQRVCDHRADPFFLYLPFTIPHANLQVPDLGPYADKPWTPPQQKIAAMIMRMDAGIGQLLDLLKELAIDENTIVFFASDNGPDRGGVREFFKASGTFRSRARYV